MELLLALLAILLGLPSALAGPRDEPGSVTIPLDGEEGAGTPRIHGARGRPLVVLDGYDVTTAGDGVEALERLRRAGTDLVLTDVMMPRLDGFGLLRAVREDPALTTTPVVMLSARAGEEGRLDGLQAGADDYLLKPFDRAALEQKLSEISALV